MSATSSLSTATVRVTLPHHLKTLAGTGSEITLTVARPVTQRSILDALEHRYPMLCGTLRHHDSQKRRSKVRFFADQQDVSHDSPDSPLPKAIASGEKPFMIIGAIAGG